MFAETASLMQVFILGFHWKKLDLKDSQTLNQTLTLTLIFFRGSKEDLLLLCQCVFSGFPLLIYHSSSLTKLLFFCTDVQYVLFLIHYRQQCYKAFYFWVQILLNKTQILFICNAETL